VPIELPVVEKILSANDLIAVDNRKLLDAHGVVAINVMASPGAGKTSLILRSIEALRGRLRVGVVEGDVAGRVDADKVAASGTPVVQINTGGGCHLDAPMVRAALPKLPLRDLRVLFIENVGNLVCPAEFDLGADLAVVVASVPEGHDKPYKYPGMFASADVVLLNKFDLVDVFDFDVQYFSRGLSMVNPGAPIFSISCKAGTGLRAWTEWLLQYLKTPTR
jgi:hydrogenase nickel incorporation protein HypB